MSDDRLPEPIKPELLDELAYNARASQYPYGVNIRMLPVFSTRLATLGSPPLTNQLLAQLDQRYGERLPGAFDLAQRLYEQIDPATSIFNSTLVRFKLRSNFINHTGRYVVTIGLLPQMDYGVAIADLAETVGLQPAAVMLLSTFDAEIRCVPDHSRCALMPWPGHELLCPALTTWTQRALTLTIHLLNLSVFITRVVDKVDERTGKKKIFDNSSQEQVLALCSPEWRERNQIKVDNTWVAKCLEPRRNGGLIKMVAKELEKVILLKMAEKRDRPIGAMFEHAYVCPYAKG